MTTAVPCLADGARQAAFLADTLAPLLAQAEAGQAVVYFADGGRCRPQHARHPCVNADGQRTPLLTVRGRERVNLSAALNVHCPTQVHVDETDCVNAQSTQRLYEQLLAAHPRGPVYVVCDNACYYKNRALSA